MTPEEYEKTKLTCSRCKKDASIGIPCIDSRGHILCHNCLREVRDNVLRFGIEQRSNVHGELLPPRNSEFVMNGHTLRFHFKEVWKRIDPRPRFGYSHPLWDVSAWTNDEAAFPLTKDECIQFIINPAEYFNLVQRYEDQGLFRCTSCKETFPLDRLGGRPLFAGKVCKACWKKHLDHLADQKKKGNTCSMCGEPRDNCCC